MRFFKNKKTILILSLMLSIFLLASCSPKGDKEEVKEEDNISSEATIDIENEEDFDKIIEEARGSKVTFYGWGGDEHRNKWLVESYGKGLKEKYDITLELVGMDIDQILNKLSSEKEAGTEEGSIDMIWINGENFFTAMENDFLYGPFLEKLSSYEKYLDTEDEETNFDFGYPIEGYEAPYGKAQIVLINDRARTEETPKNTDEFLEFVKKYEGQVTYPALPDFTGSAFVRNIIYEICGHEQFMDMEADKEVVREAVMPAMEYLRSLNPYLWNQGNTFPATSQEQDSMFVDGELVFNVSYSSYGTTTKIEEGTYPDTVRTFVFDKGTIGNTSYIGIAKNSPNKAAAMVAIDYMTSAEMQLSQFEELKTIPVIDNKKLTDEEKAGFEKVDTGKGTLSQEELLSKRLPEMPAALVPIIEEIWLEEVVGQ